MIAVSDPTLAARLRQFRHHGDISDLARHAADDSIFEAHPELGLSCCRVTDI